MALTRTGRVQWASSWSNAQRRDTISEPASLPIANASTPPRSFSRAFTARFVGPSMNGLPRKPGCARPRCPRDRLAQADRHIAEASPELCPQCRATKITRGICIIPLPIAARVIPIAQSLDSSEFDPETKRVMAVAFEMARAALQLGDQGNLINKQIAKRIIELAKIGELNPDLLCESALKEFRQHLQTEVAATGFWSGTLFCCGAWVFHRLPATSRQLRPRPGKSCNTPVNRMS